MAARGYSPGMKLHLPGHKEHHGGDEAPEREVPPAEEVGPGPAVERRAPDTPSQLPKPACGAVLRGRMRAVKDDELTDRAAALTYYGLLSLRQALLGLLSMLGLTGKPAPDTVLRNLKQF